METLEEKFVSFQGSKQENIALGGVQLTEQSNNRKASGLQSNMRKIWDSVQN